MTTNGKKMTEAEAWRFLALKWENALPDLSGDLYALHGVYGICVAAASLRGQRMITEEVWAAMRTRVKDYEPMFGDGGAYYWRFDREGADCRVLACGLLAAMADDDAKGRKP